jgi:uncharacterized membrane protein
MKKAKMEKRKERITGIILGILALLYFIGFIYINLKGGKL